MIRRVLKASIISLMLIVILAPVVLAAWEYRFPTTFVDTSSTTRTYYPVLLDYGGQRLIDDGKIAATGLDTNMQEGTDNIEFMMGTTQVATVLPRLPNNGQTTANLYTGFTPNQTNFPVIVGENGRVETADAAALELGNTFSVEYSGYIDTSRTHYPLVYKPGSFLFGVPAVAGRITGGFINVDSYDVTPGVFAAWTDVDVSAYIAHGATGVVVEIDTQNNNKDTGVRKNGSTDDRRTDTEHYWAMVGVDSSGIFETYLEDNTVHLYIRAYTDANWTFKTDAVDISLGGVGAWTDIDVTASTSSDAVGVVIEIVNGDALPQNANVRKNGSTDNRLPALEDGDHVFRVVGLDDDEIFEGQIGDLDVDFFLIGYVEGGATFATNGTDKSLGVALAWTDVDCSVEAPDATYLFFETASAVQNDGVGFRENGSSDNIITDFTWGEVQGITKCDINQICESYEENIANISSFLIGYVEYGIYPPFPNPTYNFSVTAVPLLPGEKRVTVYSDGVDLFIDIDGVNIDSVATGGAGAADTTNNWRFMSLASPYMTYYTHEVAAALQLTYEPNSIVNGATVEDETNAFDGTIAWGDNQYVTVVYGGMVGFESTDAIVSGAGQFNMPASPLPTTWFAAGGNLVNLPVYDSFNNVATQIGMPVQTLYFICVIGIAFGLALFVIMFTRSALFGVATMLIVLFVGSSQTIVPMWIPFVVLLVNVAIMFLYKQVSY